MIGALLACAACDGDGAPTTRDPALETPSRVEPALADPEAAAPEEPASWPTDVEDLAGTLERFESENACLASLRARTPTSVSEALGDLGYDRFFDDVCAGLAAARHQDAERCDALSVSTARAGCRRRVAIVAGDPALCPSDLVLEGREPLCVAWAARDPGLCRAAATADRGACEAVLAGDASPCARESRARCAAWVSRYASALGSERVRGEGTREDPELHLTMERAYPEVSPSETPAGTTQREEVTLPQLARGVRLRAVGCAHRLVLDERGEPSPAPLGRAGARIEVDVPAIAELPLEIALGPLGGTLEVTHPRAGRASGGEGTITIATLDRARGGAVAGTLEAELPMTPGVLRVSGRFHTFVRDLEPLPSSCAGDRVTAP